MIEPGLVAPSSLPGTPPGRRSSPSRYLRQTDVGVLHAGELCGWRRRAPAGPVPPHIPTPRGRYGRPCPGSYGGSALLSSESPGGGGGGALSRAGGAEGGAPPGLTRAGVETPPSPVEVLCLILCANRRVDPVGWWFRVVVWCSVFSLVPGTPLRWFPPSRVAGSRTSSLCLVGVKVGAR